MLRVLIVIALCSACTRKSEKYCGLHPEDLYNCPASDASVDRPTCTSDSQCTSPEAKKCFKPTGGDGVCVGCLANGDCTGANATCDQTTLTCRSCYVHDDCESRACLPDGTCALTSDVIYVAQGGSDAGQCTAGMPCATIDYAVSKATATRFYVKLAGTLTGPFIIDSKDVTVLGDGAKINGTGIAIKTQKATVHIYGVEIDCGGEGVKAEMESTLFAYDLKIYGCMTYGIHGKASVVNVTRSAITGCPSSAIYLESSVTAYSITNNLLYKNGSDASLGPAAKLDTPTTTMGRFEHNTIADNLAKSDAGAVNCAGAVQIPFNLFAGNTGDPLAPDVEGACLPVGGMSYPDVGAAGIDPNTYHLLPGSPAIDMAIGSAMEEDVDRQVRPQGGGTDLGADEFKP